MISSKTLPTPASVASHYNELSPFYLEMWGEHLHHGLWTTGRETIHEAVEHLAHTVAAHAQLRHGQQICDVGCGYGATARLFERTYGVKVTGLSLSTEQIAYARQAGGSGEYLERDWLKNELPSESFDAVVAIESSEHMEDKKRFVAEAARVLKPGGRLVVCAWLVREHAKDWEERWLLEPICREGRMPSMGTFTDYRALIEGAGLTLKHLEDLSPHVARTWSVCCKRLSWGIASKPRYWRFLANRAAQNRDFALSVFRIMAAYRLGSMRYGIFVAEKPAP